MSSVQFPKINYKEVDISIEQKIDLVKKYMELAGKQVAYKIDSEILAVLKEEIKKEELERQQERWKDIMNELLEPLESI